jgi:hypothetical protein
MTTLKISESITFQEAIAATQSLLEEIEASRSSDREITEAIASLVKSTNGARGFFVTYLTDDRNFADFPTDFVIEALKSSPEIVSELLVKNVAMSAAMAVVHRRNNDENMAKGSDRVCQRSIQLIQKLQLDETTNKLKQLQQSITTSEGSYGDFLQRWGYASDREQIQAIQEAITAVLA